MLKQISVLNFKLWMTSINCTDRPPVVYPSISWRTFRSSLPSSGCECAAVNIHGLVFLGTCIFHFSGCVPRNGAAGSKGNCFNNTEIVFGKKTVISMAFHSQFLIRVKISSGKAEPFCLPWGITPLIPSPFVKLEGLLLHNSAVWKRRQRLNDRGEKPS